MKDISFWFDFFRDKRFSLRFKLANFIMNDYLRNYLAVGCMCPLTNGLENIEAETWNEEYLQWQMQRVYDTIKEIFEI